jgi:peroxiredoxin
VAGGLVVLLVAVSVVLATRPSYQATEAQSPLIGHPAPALTGTTLTGQHLDLASYRGRWVYVNYFASWCSPCQAEEPDLVAFNYEQSQRADGAALVSVVYDDPDQAARQFVSQWGATWPAVLDPGGTLANAYGVTSPPTTFLIDPAGRVAGVYLGPTTKAQLDSLLETARRGDG